MRDNSAMTATDHPLHAELCRGLTALGIDTAHAPALLAYLDLFKLYHRLGRRDEYEGLRDEFNRVFNAGAPPFERYADKGRGLDAYETAMGRIQALWPQPRVLDLIERSIFRDAEEGETEVFDLEAYRDRLAGMLSPSRSFMQVIHVLCNDGNVKMILQVGYDPVGGIRLRFTGSPSSLIVEL